MNWKGTEIIKVIVNLGDMLLWQHIRQLSVHIKFQIHLEVQTASQIANVRWNPQSDDAY